MNQFINNAASIGSSPNQVDLYLGPSSDKVGAHEKFKHSGPLSDTEIEYRTNTVTNSSKKEKEIEWSWNWGGFPIKDESLSKSDSINNKESSLYNNQDTSIKDSVKTVDIAFDNSADLTLTNSLNAIEESSKFMEISTCGLKEVTSTATRVY